MRSVPRILVVVLGSYAVAWLVGALGTRIDALFFDSAAAGAAAAHHLATDVILGMSGAALAGYLCARFAPTGRMLISLGLLVVVFFVVNLVSVRMEASPDLPQWYFAMVSLLAFIGLWTGVMTERAIHGKPA